MTLKEMLKALSEGKTIKLENSGYPHFYKLSSDGGVLITKTKNTPWVKASHHLKYLAEEPGGYEIYEPKKVKEERTYYMYDEELQYVKDNEFFYGTLNDQKSRKCRNKVTISWEEEEEEL